MKLLKKILVNGCILYTCISLLLLIVNLIATSAMGDSLDKAPIPALTFLLLFPFGLAIASANQLLGSASLDRMLGRLLHYLITVLSLWLFLWLPSGTNARAATVLVLFALVTILYWAAVGILALIKGRYQRIVKGR